MVKHSKSDMPLLDKHPKLEDIQGKVNRSKETKIVTAP